MVYADIKCMEWVTIKNDFHCLGCTTHFGLILSKLASGAGNKLYRSDTSVENLKE